MAYCPLCKRNHNVDFISMRLAGTDEVSPETAKWADVFERAGFACYYFAGELDRPTGCSCLVREAHFQHSDINDILRNCFGTRKGDGLLSKKSINLNAS